METLTSRTEAIEGKDKLSLNLAEFIFIRRSGIAW